MQSLQAELTELRRSEALARSSERHQQLVDGLQRRHAEELAAQQQRLDTLAAQLETQTAAAASLRAQLADSEQTRHRLAADKGDVINQLTAGLEAAQARCRQLMQSEPAQLRERLAQQEQQREQLQLQLAAAQVSQVTPTADCDRAARPGELETGDHMGLGSDCCMLNPPCASEGHFAGRSDRAVGDWWHSDYCRTAPASA